MLYVFQVVQGQDFQCGVVVDALLRCQAAKSAYAGNFQAGHPCFPLSHLQMGVSGTWPRSMQHLMTGKPWPELEVGPKDL